MANAKANPYEDLPNAGFVKFGNLLENQDCQDTSNPLCIDSRVWWTAMQKAYDYRKKEVMKPVKKPRTTRHGRL